jgi:site-specific DNA recombinase
MTQAVVYVRISADREGAGLGVDRQEADCRDLAAALGWDIVRVFVDNDISAYSGKPRPGYKEMLDALAAGEANAVLAWHTDRLYRKPADLEPLIDLAKTKGVSIQTVKAGKLDLSTPTGVLLAGILAEVSRYEITHNQERLQTYHKQRASQGHAHGGARPFGWKKDRLTRDPVEAAEIRAWAIHVLAGGSLQDLVRGLNKREVPTAQGRTWQTRQVRQVLLSPRLAGWRTHHGEITARGQWEPILADDAHRQLVAILTDPKRRTSPADPGRIVYQGTGLYRCDECDMPMLVKHTQKRGKPKQWYHCGGCGLWRTQGSVDEYVDEYVMERLRRLEPQAPDAMADTTRVEFLEAKIRATRETFAADDSVTPAELLEILRELKAELAAEQAKLRPTVEVRKRQVLAQANASEYPDYSIVRKRSVIDALCEVRLKRNRPGRPGRGGFDGESVRIERR